MNTSLPTVLLTSACVLLTTGSGVAAAETSPAGAHALRVGVSPNSPPMIFKDGKKNIVGVEADFARALGRELGRDIRFVELPWEDLLDALNENKIDIIMSSMSITRARRFRVAFSDPYLRVGQMALVRANEKFLFLAPALASQVKQTIGVKKGTTGDLLVQQDFPRAKRKYYNSGDDAARALKKGTIDAFINDSTMIWYLAGVHEAEGLVVAPMALSDEVLAWGVNRSDTQLLLAVNTFLKKFKASGELDRVLQKWIPKFH